MILIETKLWTGTVYVQFGILINHGQRGENIWVVHSLYIQSPPYATLPAIAIKKAWASSCNDQSPTFLIRRRRACSSATFREKASYVYGGGGGSA